VPTGFAAQPWRRAITLIAVWLVVVQAFLSGIAAAQAGGILAADPLGVAVICHGGEGSGAAEPAAPGTDTAWHLCCAYCCASSAPALAPPSLPNFARADFHGAALPVLASFTIVVTRGAVRAGFSQAPPSRA
jgi:hypothetical protein